MSFWRSYHYCRVYATTTTNDTFTGGGLSNWMQMQWRQIEVAI